MSMSFFATFERMVVILFTIALGYMAKRLDFCTTDTDRRLTKLILNITQPCLILASVMTNDTPMEIHAILSTLKMTVAFYGLGTVALLIFPRFLGGTPQQKGVWRFSFLLPNTAFIGYPVIEALFGSSAIFYGVILNLPFHILSFSFGPMMLGGSRRFDRKVLYTPSMIASVVSLVIALSGIRTPALLGSMTDFVGDITVPLALIMLGSTLAGMPAKNVMASPKLWLLAGLRLLAMPAIFWLVLQPFGLESVVLNVAVLEMAMPVGIVGAMLCMEYDGDIQCMAQGIFLSTLLSMITIPLVASILL